MKNKIFYIIINSIIITTLGIGMYGNYYIFNNFNLSIFNIIPINIMYIIMITIVILETLIITTLINQFYNTPINKLEYIIKSFIVGRLETGDIKIKSTINPHIKYIFLFFLKTLNTLKGIKEEFIHGKEIKGEVALGMEIQSKMLNKKMANVPSLNIVAKSKPAAEIGGDSYDIIKQNDNYYIYVGDATGHGVGAGLIMIMVNSLVSGFSKIFKSGAKILSSTNEILKPRIKANLLMTILLIRWDEKEKRLFMTGAGHEYLLIYKNKEKKCYKIKSGGVALGMIKDISKILKEREIKFEQNDIAILYSDGITEAINQSKRDGNEEMFGANRLIEVIEKTPNEKSKTYKSASSVFNNITIELSKFMGYKFIQLDDITLTVIQYKSEEGEKKEGKFKRLPNDFITDWNW